VKSYIRLVVLSDSMEPDEIINQIDLVGDKVWKRGDKRGNTLILEKENGWMVNSKEKNDSEIERHIESIRSIIRGKESILKHMSQEGGCIIQLSYAIYSKDEPPLSFNKDIINWLGSVGASLDVDLYLSKSSSD